MSKQEQAVSSVGPWPKLDSAAAAGPHAAISPRTRTTVLQPETGSLTPGRMGQDTGRQEAVRLELAAPLRDGCNCSCSPPFQENLL